MGNFTLGFKALFRIWGDSAFASRVAPLLETEAEAAPEPKPIQAVEKARPVSDKAKPVRSEALTLLAVLQREGRLVDFLMEPIAGFTDAQIGSAVRSVHADCAATLGRLFDFEPLRSEPEGARIEIPSGYDPAQFRLVGNVKGGGGPVRGKLSHAGWKAARCDLPEWNGRPEAALVVAACKVQV